MMELVSDWAIRSGACMLIDLWHHQSLTAEITVKVKANMKFAKIFAAAEVSNKLYSNLFVLI